MDITGIDPAIGNVVFKDGWDIALGVVEMYKQKWSDLDWRSKTYGGKVTQCKDAEQTGLAASAVSDYDQFPVVL